jgi:hypothetical protein
MRQREREDSPVGWPEIRIFSTLGIGRREQFLVFTPRRFEAEEVISSLKLDILLCMCHGQQRIGGWRIFILEISMHG